MLFSSVFFIVIPFSVSCVVLTITVSLSYHVSLYPCMHLHNISEKKKKDRDEKTEGKGVGGKKERRGQNKDTETNLIQGERKIKASTFLSYQLPKVFST